MINLDTVAEFRPQISLYIKGKLSDAWALAERITLKFRHRSFTEMVQIFLSICVAIDEIKVAAVGRDASTRRSNHLMGLIAQSFCLKFYAAAGQTEFDYLAKMIGQFGARSQFSWQQTKLLILEMRLKSLSMLKAFILSLPKPEGEMGGAVVSDLLQGLKDLRRYGVKDSFLNNPWSGFKAKSLALWDPRDFSIPPVDKNSPPIMDENDLIVAGFTSRRMQKIVRPEFGDFAGDVKGFSFNSEELALQGIIWKLSSDGELYLMHGESGQGLRAIFAQHGSEDRYEALRHLTATLLFDLTVARETVRKFPAVSRPFMERVLDGFKKYPSILNLIVPRVRFLQDNYPEICREISEEIEQGEEETRRRQKREHEVAAFVRALPRGYKASANARQLALKYGIVLKEGETFVRKHGRGKGNPVKGHRLLVRN